MRLQGCSRWALLGARPELWLNTHMDVVFPELWGRKEGEFKPDGQIFNHEMCTVHVLKLTRWMQAHERV